MSNAARVACFAGVAVVIAAAAGYSERPPAVGSASYSKDASGGLTMVSTTIGDRSQLITVLDPMKRVLCVYHIDL